MRPGRSQWNFVGNFTETSFLSQNGGTGHDSWADVFCTLFFGCQDTHDKMECWCKTNGEEKTKSIEEAQTKIKARGPV